MRLRVLSTFLAVADQGSFTKAAEQLYTTQSTVSRCILELENELGCQLFERSPQKIQLTQTGHMLYKRAQRILNEWEQIKWEAKLHQSRPTDLRIGYTFSGIVPYVSRALEHKRFPFRNLDLKLRFGQGEDMVKMMREGTLDCAIMHRPSLGNATDMHVDLIQKSSMSIMVPLSNPLARQKEVTLARLSQETEVRCTQDPSFYQMADSAFYGAGLQPMLHVVTTEPDDCMPLVQYNGHVCYCPSIYVPWDGCALLTIVDWPVDYDLVFVYLQNQTNATVEYLYAAMCASLDSPV